MGALYLMIGFPGSGKSHYARFLASKLQDAVIHSSDGIRKELFGSEDEQKDTLRVFEILDRRVLIDLQAGKNVIYDATNLRRADRAKVIDDINTAGIRADIIAVYMNISIQECKSYNQNRSRVVPEEVYDRMSKSFSAPELEEGFDQIWDVKIKRL